MKKRYRIVPDDYCGYEAQQWVWYWPFWRQINFTNTHRTVEEAKMFIDRMRSKPIDY